jgi:RimJ/RimL family protein N-acetyltransferase
VYAVSSPEQPFVGTVAIVLETDAMEIGFRLQESFWGQGLGRRIAALALAVARHEHPGRRVFARCDVGNVASLRSLESLGGTREADGHDKVRFSWHDA